MVNYITAISLLIQFSMFWHLLFFKEVNGFVNSPRITVLFPGITCQSLFQNVFINFVISETSKGKIKQEVDLVFMLTGLSVVSPVHFLPAGYFWEVVVGVHRLALCKSLV